MSREQCSSRNTELTAKLIYLTKLLNQLICILLVFREKSTRFLPKTLYSL